MKHMCIYIFRLYIYLFIYLLTYSFIHLSLIYLCIYSFIYSFIYLFVTHMCIWETVWVCLKIGYDCPNPRSLRWRKRLSEPYLWRNTLFFFLRGTTSSMYDLPLPHMIGEMHVHKHQYFGPKNAGTVFFWFYLTWTMTPVLLWTNTAPPSFNVVGLWSWYG